MSEVWSAWDFRDRSSVAAGRSLVGYTVVATDGEVGEVVEATTDAGTSSLVVRREGGPDDRLMLPAGIVDRVDDSQRRIYVERTRQEVEGAPELTSQADDPKYRDMVATYYGGYYWTAPSSAVSEQARERATEQEG